jgi:hypothetical protein
VKNIGVPIIIAIIAGVIALISALINYIIAALFIPNLDISKEPNQEQNKKTIIDITNIGSAPAKSLKLTVQAPQNISFKHPIFSTEIYNETKTEDPARLELYIPRFIQGDGSMIRIEALINNRSNMTSGNYIFYATYDQGSIRKTIPISEKVTAPTIPFLDQFANWWSQYGNAISWIYVAIVSAITAAFLNHRRQRRRQQI